MDGLRSRARREFFAQQKFSSAPGFYTIVEVFESSNGAVTTRKRDISRGNLIQQLREPGSPGPACEEVVRRSQIIAIHREKTGSLRTSRELFVSIFDALKLDNAVLAMILRESYGFQQLRSGGATRGDNGGGGTFYLKTISSLITWSYDAESGCSRAMFIPRVSDSILDGAGIFASFVDTLDSQRHLVRFGGAWFLRFIALVELARWIDRILELVLDLLREAESYTGHGCWEAWEFQDRAGNTVETAKTRVKKWEHALAISRTLGFSVSTLANVERHIHITPELAAIEELTAEAARVSDGARQGEDATRELAETRTALDLILKQVLLRAADVRYMQERARNHLSIVFNLLSQSDTAMNLSIAASARRDSDSMKVVALMTLFFLPGTFFAALFAIPSLHWAEDTVISPQFWVYWAFTAPVTLFVVGLYWGRNKLKFLLPSKWRPTETRIDEWIQQLRRESLR